MLFVCDFHGSENCASFRFMVETIPLASVAPGILMSMYILHKLSNSS